jgi:hypothetical protein
MSQHSSDSKPTVREMTSRTQQVALAALRNHVANRAAMLKRFEQLSHGTKHVSDAQALLDKARSDYRAFAVSIGADAEPDELDVRPSNESA